MRRSFWMSTATPIRGRDCYAPLAPTTSSPRANQAPGCAASHASSDGISSPHDRVDFKHDIHADDVVPDPRPRSLFLDSWTPAGAAPIALGGYSVDQVQPPLQALTLKAGMDGLGVSKRYTLDGARLEVSWEFSGRMDGMFTTEINLAMPSCDGFGGSYELADGSIPGGFGQDVHLFHLQRINLRDSELGGRLELSACSPVTLSAAPHFTVSQSEAGFEKVMQAATLRLSWPLSLGSMTLVLEVVKAGRE